MMFLRIFKHLLPNGRAWRITIDKQLRRFFEGLSGAGSDVKAFFDGVYADVFPQTTRALGRWEQQFALPDTGLDEQQRRDRLSATWKALGGQDPRYIQDTLRANGFDVYVHEWWIPGTQPAVGVKGCATARNPLFHLRREFTGVVSGVNCGEALALCGEEFAVAGNSTEPQGYPLVNKLTSTTPDEVTLCGEEAAQCGEPEAICGNYFQFREVPRNYVVPLDPDKWPYFLYIGGETFGDLATVDVTRRNEFETLCLKICPAQQWLGMLVQYN